MRISGLASGMDIDSMVKNLMKAERVPLDKLNQQKQLLEWKRESYRQVSTKLVSFHDKLNSFSMSNAIGSKQATVNGENVLTAKATGNATNSILDIEVKSLAIASRLVSSNGTVGGKAVDTKISEIMNGQGDQIIKIGSSGENGKLAEITVTGNETIQDLINKINSNKDAGVTAIYDPSSGNMSLTSKETGNKAEIYVDGALLTDTFGLKSANVKKGRDAEVIINGITTFQASNKFTQNGIEIALTGVTTNGQSTQIQVSQDVDSIVNTIKSFVDTYNETLAFLNQNVGEERFRKYSPLTSEQKSDMSEDEIKLWESKAKSGMLKNDTILEKAISEMRSALIMDSTIQGKMTIMDVGLTTGSYGEKGKLYLDEDKLRKALETDPDQVMSLFVNVDTSKKTEYTTEDGIFSRLKKIEQESLKRLSEKAGTSRVSSDLSASFLPQSQIGDQISNFDKRIDDMENRMLMIETRYYKQFTAMETAMNKFNSTSSSLFSMMS